MTIKKNQLRKLHGIPELTSDSRAITLHVISGHHEQCRRLKIIFGASGESIKLEINK